VNIPGRVNLDSIEKVIDDHVAIPRGTLFIPSSIYYGGGFGVEANLILAIATWGNAELARTLRLRVRNGDLSSHAESLVRSIYGLAALYFATGIEDILGEGLDRRSMLARAAPLIDAMHRGSMQQLLHGPTINLVCVRNAQREYLRPLYSAERDGAVRERREFEKLLAEILDACLPSSIAMFARSRLAKPLGEVAYELFKNTDQHSLTTPRGDFYRKHMRGLTVRFRKIGSSDITNITGASPKTAPYFGRLNSMSATKGDLALLELSVFDTGPGMTRRWLGHEVGAPCSDLRSVSVEQELDALKKCFQEHSTTKSTPSSGEGLDLVTRLLWRFDGFLRVRTGRLCIFQGFNSKKEFPGFQPEHWFPRQQLGGVLGTAVTVCVPLPAK
jgi:hypothetical protein